MWGKSTTLGALILLIIFMYYQWDWGTLTAYRGRLYVLGQVPLSLYKVLILTREVLFAPSNPPPLLAKAEVKCPVSVSPYYAIGDSFFEI